VPHGTAREDVRPERTDRRAHLVCAIARGRRWLDEIIAGSVSSPQQLAQREQRTVRQVNLTLSLAFLAPQLVKARSKGGSRAASTSNASATPTPNGAGSSRTSASIRMVAPNQDRDRDYDLPKPIPQPPVFLKSSL
jgi:hypothetical protein